MSPKPVFTTIPYTLDDVQLASLVPNIRNPNQDALSLRSLVTGADVSVRVQKNFQARLKNGTNSMFRARLSRLLSLLHDKEDVSATQISALEGRMYELKQPKALFKEICTRKQVQEWLQEGLEDGQDTYFVVGYHTFFNAKMLEQNHSASHNHGEVRIPVAEGVAAIAGPLVGTALDASLSASKEAMDYEIESSELPGERIYAICYRRILFKWFKAGQADAAYLEPKVRWKMVSDDRAPNVDDEEVEVDLDDQDKLEGAVPDKQYITADEEGYIYLLDDEIS